MSKFILAIDQGTTGTTVSLVNSIGEQIYKVNEEFEQIFPQPAWVEHNLNDIWNTVKNGVENVIKNGKNFGLSSAADIIAIGITNQRETVGIWNRKNSKAVHNAIVWQCRRTTEFCLKNKDKESWIRKKTGLVLDPYFSASKIAWLIKNVNGLNAKIKQREVVAGTIDTYLLWKLTAGEVHATDYSNASRTSLMNIEKGEWDDELLKFFKVPKHILPEIKASSGIFGYTKGLSFLPDGIPISGIAGDQQAALFGQACFKAGEAKCTFGTGSFLLMNTGKEKIKSKNGMLTTVAWKLFNDKEITYALEGSAFICGAAVQWLRDQLRMINTAPEIEKLAAEVESSEGVEFVPAFTGLGAPYWEPEARALITGMTRGTNRSHIARACLDGMALQNVDLLKAMEMDLGKKMKNLKVDGGASLNDLLMQIQSDYLGSKVVRPKMIETTALGAAYLAGLGVGHWSSLKEIKDIWQTDKEFQCKYSKKQRETRYEAWQTAVQRCKPMVKKTANKKTKRK